LQWFSGRGFALLQAFSATYSLKLDLYCCECLARGAREGYGTPADSVFRSEVLRNQEQILQPFRMTLSWDKDGVTVGLHSLVQPQKTRQKMHVFERLSS
jgi:hypothetical protein